MKQDSKYLIKRGDVWYIQHRVNGSLTKKSTGTGDLRRARKIRDEYMSPFRLEDKKATTAALVEKINTIEQLQEDAKPVIELKDLWQCYMSSSRRPDSGKRTLHDYEQQWSIFYRWIVEQHSGIVEARQVVSVQAAEFINHLKNEGYSPRSIVKYLNLLQLIWRVCRDEAKLPDNIWDKDHITRPTVDKLAGRKEALSIKELETLLHSAEDKDIHDLLVLLAYTGQRLGDIACLRWDAIDLKEGVIMLAPRKTARRSGKVVYIPLMPDARKVLEGRIRFPEDLYVIPEIKSSYDKNAAALTVRIKKVFSKAGLITTRKGNSVRARTVHGAHSLRHTFVTIARSSGLPDAFIQSITGHMTNAMVDHYTHFNGKLAAAFGQKEKNDNVRVRLHHMIDQLGDSECEQLLNLLVQKNLVAHT